MLAAMPKPIETGTHGGRLKLDRTGKTVKFQTCRRGAETPDKAANSRNWHEDCYNTYLTRAQGLGVAAHSQCKPVKSRGGVHNHADRESHSLSAAQVDSLKISAAHAVTIGLPFNRMITIHWQAAGVPLAGMANATGRFIHLMTKTIARHHGNTAWLWVHENGEGKGGHCHLLAHIPADLVGRITGLQKRWLRSITGNAYRARVIRSDPIGGRLGLESGNPALHTVNLAAALAYVVKGADTAAASQFNLERLEPGGMIIGKRCGTSQNIGAKARKARGCR